MRVLVVGLGDIARKAYLPVLAATPGLGIHLATRSRAALDDVGTHYRLEHRHSSIDEALSAASFDAAFVHAATAAHPALVERLLAHGIPVLVDKPLADNLADAARLIDLAVRSRRLLMVGFNRRFAPDYAALRDLPRTLLVMQKHRHAQPDAIRRVVFDDFIHVVDTLRFLAPGPVQRQAIEVVARGDVLDAVTLTLAGAGFHAIGSMVRTSGLDEERLDILGGDAKRSIVNLSERIDYDRAEQSRRRGDWTPVSRQRGFEAMCADFLDAVRSGRPTPADDLLETHRLCEDIVTHAERDRAQR